MSYLRTFSFIAATLLSAQLTTSASADWLDANAEIRTLVEGRQIYLETPFGGEFPLRYMPDGKVSGDGTKLGLAQYFSPKETGNWWVENGQLCQKFPTWYEGRTNCFRLEPTGANQIRWLRDDGYSGDARIGG